MPATCVLKKRRSVNFFNLAKSSVVPATRLLQLIQLDQVLGGARYLRVGENELRQLLQLDQALGDAGNLRVEKAGISQLLQFGQVFSSASN